jgi:hypothetical protein
MTIHVASVAPTSPATVRTRSKHGCRAAASVFAVMTSRGRGSRGPGISDAYELATTIVPSIGERHQTRAPQEAL